MASGYRPDLNDAIAPPEVNAVIEACWRGPPALRPSADEVVKMLEAVEEKGELRCMRACRRVGRAIATAACARARWASLARLGAWV